MGAFWSIARLTAHEAWAFVSSAPRKSARAPSTVSTDTSSTAVKSVLIMRVHATKQHKKNTFPRVLFSALSFEPLTIPPFSPVNTLTPLWGPSPHSLTKQIPRTRFHTKPPPSSDSPCEHGQHLIDDTSRLSGGPVLINPQPS